MMTKDNLVQNMLKKIQDALEKEMLYGDNIHLLGCLSATFLAMMCLVQFKVVNLSSPIQKPNRIQVTSFQEDQVKKRFM